MRRLLYVLVLLAALLLGAEVALTFLSQWGMGRALSAQYGLPQDTEVRINSFPFLVSVMRNHLGEVRFYWNGILIFRKGFDEKHMAYEGEAILRDVGLSMSAVIRGKLEIESISSAKITVSLNMEDIAAFLDEGGRETGSDDVTVAREADAGEDNYQVKVLDENHICLYPSKPSTLNLDEKPSDEAKDEGSGICLEISGLPLDGFLKTASLDGKKLILQLGVPLWFGYLDSSISN